MNDDIATYAYMAGLIDGEGSIQPYAEENIVKGWLGVHIKLNIANTDMNMLNWCDEHWSGHICKHVSKQEYVWWQWTALTKSLVDIFEGCLPYLITKKEEVECALRLRQSLDSTSQGTKIPVPVAIARLNDAIRIYEIHHERSSTRKTGKTYEAMVVRRDELLTQVGTL